MDLIFWKNVVVGRCFHKKIPSSYAESVIRIVLSRCSVLKIDDRFPNLVVNLIARFLQICFFFFSRGGDFFLFLFLFLFTLIRTGYG